MKTYREVENELKEVAATFGTLAGNSPFKGKNFITDRVVSRRKLKGADGVWFELSYGRGMTGDWLYGVSFADHNGGDYYGKSTCCFSVEEVREVIEAVKGA